MLDLKHLVALNKYRIIKETYAAEPNTEQQASMQVQLLDRSGQLDDRSGH